MRAAQNNGINSTLQHGAQGRLQNRARFLPIQISLLDLLHQSGTGILQKLHAVGEAFHHRGVQRALKSGRCGQHTHHARARRLGRGFDGGFHAHEFHTRKGFAQVRQRRGGGGVAGHHDEFRSLVQQEARNPLRKCAYLLQRTRPVRHVSLIAEEDHILVRHQLPHGAQDRQSAHA